MFLQSFIISLPPFLFKLQFIYCSLCIVYLLFICIVFIAYLVSLCKWLVVHKLQTWELKNMFLPEALPTLPASQTPREEFQDQL